MSHGLIEFLLLFLFLQFLPKLLYLFYEGFVVQQVRDSKCSVCPEDAGLPLLVLEPWKDGLLMDVSFEDVGVFEKQLLVAGLKDEVQDLLLPLDVLHS